MLWTTPFGLLSVPRGENQERRFVRLHLFAGTVGRLRIQQGSPVALVGLEVRLRAGAVDHHRVTQQRRVLARRAEIAKQRHGAAAAIGAIGRDHDGGTRGLQAKTDRFRAKPLNSTVWMAPIRFAGVNGDKGFRQVRQVDRHHIAAADPE